MPATLNSFRHLLLWVVIFLLTTPRAQAEEGATESQQTSWAEIQVIDEVTQRGVPLVELELVNGLKFVTDNAGRIAFREPGLMNREIYFSVRSHGYEIAKDGFGFAGVRITPGAGSKSVVKIRRTQLAERVCRLTGEGLWRDSILLGHNEFIPQNNRGRIAGQDSVQSAIYQKRIFWFWGDTARMEYPLGLFRTAGATSSIFKTDEPQHDPANGIPYEYFVDKNNFARAMLPMPERPEGVVWISALCIVPDEQGRDRMVCHYSRRKDLATELEQGIAIYNDAQNIFEVSKSLPLSEKWRRPSGHPITYEENGKKWLLFGSPTPNVRVPATLLDVQNAASYEAFTCLTTSNNPETPQLDEQGNPRWRWQKELPPIDAKQAFAWVKSGKFKPEQVHYSPVNLRNLSEPIQLHNGSVRWNSLRQRWILLAGQLGGSSSHLGEIWYAEADQPTGPFTHAVKVVTHERQSCYNVCHHDFLDRKQGRFIHFEGTYTNDFSGNPERTPRYHYNQVLFRLDLKTINLE